MSARNCNASPNERFEEVLYLCTLPRGHEGDHVAHKGTEEAYRWPQAIASDK